MSKLLFRHENRDLRCGWPLWNIQEENIAWLCQRNHREDEDSRPEKPFYFTLDFMHIPTHFHVMPV